jgi:hypothetical protein
MRKIYSFLLIPFLYWAMSPECAAVFECKPSPKNQSEYSLELTLKKGDFDTYTFDLYDLNTGTVVQSRTMDFSSGDSKVVFTKVKPSTYTVSYTGSNCKVKKAIQGKGIILQ